MRGLTRSELRRAVPPQSGTVRLPGLEAPVEVWRDPEGVAHIRARSPGDAFFAQGYAQAQDRLWQMDYDRRRAYGRWAEWVGPAGLAQDRLMRRLRLGATARPDYQQLRPESRAMLESFAAGVNAFLASTDRLPAEYRLLGAEPERWEPWDSLAIFKVRHVAMGVWEVKLWRARLLKAVGPEAVARLYPSTQPGELLILPPGATYSGPVGDALAELQQALEGLSWLREEEGGSNSWVAAGSRTASGKPLLAGDPHRAADLPGPYYPNHLACDAFDVTGLSFPGVPGFPHFDHNQRVAWSITHTGADTQDLFIERFDPADPSRYRFRGAWREAERVEEQILVRGGEPEALTVTLTHHGSVVAGSPAGGWGLSLQYTATDGINRGFDCFLPMLTARTGPELEEAMRGWVDPVNNLLWADLDGRIGYRTRGMVPVRHRLNRWAPVPGWTGEHDWQGVIPFEAMPHQSDPEGGIFVTANNRVVDESYPYYIGSDFAAEHRARRITQLLQQEQPLTPAAMAAIHADLLSLPARSFLGLLDQIDARSDRGREALALLRAWDGWMAPDEPAPAIYSALRAELIDRLLRPLLGPLAEEAFAAVAGGGARLIARLRPYLWGYAAADDRRLLLPGATWPELLSASLERAVQLLEDRLGPDPARWRWDRLHQLHPVHPLAPLFPGAAALLNPPPVPLGGDADTVQAAGFVPGTGFRVSITSVARYCFDLSDWDRSGWVLPYGVSGHPGSPHYADQAEAWASHRLLPMRYSWERIEQEAAQVQRLVPRLHHPQEGHL
ncbi:MAG: penicillin acylase family protein [Bacillota bacterium]